MQIRTPAVAGMFYSGEKKELKKSIKECFLHKFGPGKFHPLKLKRKFLELFVHMQDTCIQVQ